VNWELWESDDPFAEIEEQLARLGAGERADVFLAYRLSDSLRRTAAPAPPEPCRLPLAAIVSGPTHGARHRASDLTLGAWERSWTDAAYGDAIRAVRDAIGRGDVYQVNLVQHLCAPVDGSSHAVAARLAHLEPLHATPFVGDGWAVVSASPELFLARRGNRVWTRPIKGTRPLHSDEPIVSNAKDRAEHVMIVDLERNDLSRVCVPGSVCWPELLVEKELAGVRHAVSTVEGRLRDGVGFAELLRATFPGGSITGAPKIAALDHIAALEPVGRGAAMGALGTVHANGDFDLALTIRTFAIADGRIHLWVGGGIVWDSDPQAEIEESWTKAAPLVDSLVRQPVHA
jgi:para-aminobenzoate synthetase component 1